MIDVPRLRKEREKRKIEGWDTPCFRSVDKEELSPAEEAALMKEIQKELEKLGYLWRDEKHSFPRKENETEADFLRDGCLPPDEQYSFWRGDGDKDEDLLNYGYCPPDKLHMRWYLPRDTMYYIDDDGKVVGLYVDAYTVRILEEDIWIANSAKTEDMVKIESVVGKWKTDRGMRMLKLRSAGSDMRLRLRERGYLLPDERHSFLRRSCDTAYDLLKKGLLPPDDVYSFWRSREQDERTLLKRGYLPPDERHKRWYLPTEADYYIDEDKNVLVRRVGARVETCGYGHAEWISSPFDDSYKREIFLGEGNNCLSEYSEQAAIDEIEAWEKKAMEYLMKQEKES